MSTDGKMTAEEAIKSAREKGLGIIFTEHYDADNQDDIMTFRVDVPRYMAEYEKFRSEDVLIGIEIGLTHLSSKINIQTVAKGDFDFVLGTVHMIGQVDIYMNLTFSDNPIITKEMYLNYVLEMVKQDDFYDAFAHIDYASRFFSEIPDDKSAEMDYCEFKDVYDAIFKILVKKEKPLEINTRRLKYKSACDCMFEVLKAYKSCGGKYVTIGSDAHYAENIGIDFNEALKMAEELSFIPVYFKDRKIVKII